MNWNYCNTRFDVMRWLQIGHSDYAYLDYVYRTERSELADDGFCSETDTDIARRIVLSKSSVGRMRRRLIDRGLIDCRPTDGAVKTTEIWKRALSQSGSETQPHVGTSSSETLQKSCKTLQRCSETQQHTYISNKNIKEKESKQAGGRADEVNLIENFDPDAPELYAAGAAEKEKSSAQKEKAPATESLDDRMARAAKSIGWTSSTAPAAAGAQVRRLPPSQPTAPDAPPSPSETPEQLADRFLADTETDAGRERLQWAYRSAMIDPDETPVNLYAAVWKLTQDLHRRRRLPARISSIYGKLPGYLKTQRRIDREDAIREQQAKRHVHSPTHRPAGAFTADDICPESVALAGAEQAYREYCARNGTTG